MVKAGSNISKVEDDLINWRSNPRRGKEVPSEIKKQVVDLLSEYSFYHIQSRLGLSSKSLKTWQAEYSSDPMFIELPKVLSEEVKNSSDKLSLKVSMGNYSIEGNLELKDWKVALELLEGFK